MPDFIQACTTAASLLASLDPELLSIVSLSMSVSLLATAIALAIGAPAGGALAVLHFPGRISVVIIFNALLGLPPVVVGLVIYLLLSHSGLFGFARLLFTPAAMVIAQATLTTPIVIALMHRAMEAHWLNYGDMLRMDGASRWRCIGELFSIGRSALLTTFLAAFGRAISEVGAIIVVGGNIRGYTRTMTTAIALETSKGDLGLALALGVILILLSVAVSAASFILHGFRASRGT